MRYFKGYFKVSKIYKKDYIKTRAHQYDSYDLVYKDKVIKTNLSRLEVNKFIASKFVDGKKIINKLKSVKSKQKEVEKQLESVKKRQYELIIEQHDLNNLLENYFISKESEGRDH